MTDFFDDYKKFLKKIQGDTEDIKRLNAELRESIEEIEKESLRRVINNRIKRY